MSFKESVFKAEVFKVFKAEVFNVLSSGASLATLRALLAMVKPQKVEVPVFIPVYKYFQQNLSATAKIYGSKRQLITVPAVVYTSGKNRKKFTVKFQDGKLVFGTRKIREKYVVLPEEEAE
jgi:glycogen synthase